MSTTFIEGALSADAAGKISEAIDDLMDGFNRLFTAGLFELADFGLLDCIYSTPSPEFHIAALTATLPARDKLTRRAAYVKHVRLFLEDHKLPASELLCGLE